MSQPDLFPNDTNPLPMAGSAEQAALLEDEFEIANEDYFERLQQLSDITDNIFPELMSATRNAIAHVLPNKPLRVLDLCCGVGIVSLELLKADVPIDSLTLADLSPEILRRAEALLHKKHGKDVVKTLELVQIDLLVDDLREKTVGKYDLVVTCNAFQHFPRERQAVLFQQIHDILGPSGIFIFESHFKLLRPKWKQYLVDQMQSHLRGAGAPDAFVEKAGVHLNTFHNYVNLSEVYNWLEAADFGFFECAFRKDEIGIFAAVR